MKASKKMLNAIAKVEKKWGELEKNFGIEPIEENRVGRGFYDFCELSCKILKLQIVVAHDGTITRYR